MGKNNFIRELSDLLKKIPEEERKEVLYDYEEHFSIGLADGKSEEELIAELGDPHSIAKDLLSDFYISKAEQKKSIPNLFKAFFATVGLSFFNLIFILGPVLGIFGIYIGLCTASVALILTPLSIIGSILFNGFEGIIFLSFASMVTCSLGILLGIGMIKLGKILYHTFLRYIKLNIRVIRGEKGEKFA